MPLRHAINNNIDTLTAALQLIQQLNHHDFCAVKEPYFPSSVGTHLRHIIDHYCCFFSGMDTAHINYDQRSRNQRIAEDEDYALQQLHNIIEQLRQLDVEKLSVNVQVTLKTSLSPGSDAPVPSTTLRELVFLHSHSTHHFSLIAIILRLLNHPVDEMFGVAPSTRAYQQMTS